MLAIFRIFRVRWWVVRDESGRFVMFRTRSPFWPAGWRDGAGPFFSEQKAISALQFLETYEAAQW
jgi:hypothetical protein